MRYQVKRVDEKRGLDGLVLKGRKERNGEGA